MPDTVGVRISAELYERLNKAAKRNSTTVDAELARRLKSTLGSGKEIGRPPKHWISQAYDDVVDLLVLREVLKHPRRNAAETIKKLQGKDPYPRSQGKEPFKSQGDLYSRHMRLKGRLAGRLPTKPANVVWEPPVGRGPLELDKAWEMFSMLKRWDGKQPLMGPPWMMAVLKNLTAQCNLAVAKHKLAAAEAALEEIHALAVELDINLDGSVGKK
jgi:hypothetical protein